MLEFKPELDATLYDIKRFLVLMMMSTVKFFEVYRGPKLVAAEFEDKVLNNVLAHLFKSSELLEFVVQAIQIETKSEDLMLSKKY